MVPGASFPVLSCLLSGQNSRWCEATYLPHSQGIGPVNQNVLALAEIRWVDD